MTLQLAAGFVELHYDLPNGKQLASSGLDFSIRMWPLDRLLIPPKHTSYHEYYDTLLQLSLYQMGYRMDGFRLIPEPRFHLSPKATSISF